ncbi:MAG: cytosine deaminase [Xenococcus sp. (in: cyanobacteria)]
MISRDKSYWLTNAHIPESLIPIDKYNQKTREGLCLVDILIEQGKIKQVVPTTKIKNDNIYREGCWGFPHSRTSPSIPNRGVEQINLHKQIILPCFIDLHTHLDKGHIWERSPNLDGTFDTALKTVRDDAQRYWQTEDLTRRIEFSLKSAYAYGTKAIRTHIDSFGQQADISWQVLQDLQQKWQEKITLQGVSLVSLDYYQTAPGVTLADKIQEVDGILGGVAYINPNLDQELDNIFKLAIERNLDLDFHADENGDIDSICLQKIAQTAIRRQFSGNITCGHCCSLAVQPPEIVSKTIDLVKQAQIAIVSLPMCNLYLQDRQVDGTTPYWRGVTRVHELQQEDIPVSFASDNTRDPFFGFGDLDMLEVWSQAVKIAHLDTPYRDWIDTVTKTPAQVMQLSDAGKIEPGLTADLIIFKARYFSELLSRSHRDRIVLRNGQQIDTSLPDYAELDDLLGI